MLLRFKTLNLCFVALFECWKELVFVLCACYRIKTVKDEFSSACTVLIFTASKDDALLFKHRIFHLTSHKTLINETIKFYLIRFKVFYCDFRSELQHSRADSLVRFLCPFCFFRVDFRRFWKIFFTISILNNAANCTHCFLCEIE